MKRNQFMRYKRFFVCPYYQVSATMLGIDFRCSGGDWYAVKSATVLNFAIYFLRIQ